MDVLVIGAGVIGTASALELAKRGHKVTVMDGWSEPGLGASYANAGLVSPGHSFSWAAPGVLKNLPGIVTGRNDGLGIAAWNDPALWAWSIRFLRECRPKRWRANSRAAIALAAYSRNLMRDQAALPEDSYCEARNGILYLYADAYDCDQAELELLDENREQHMRLQGADLDAIEPLLSVSQLRFGMGLFCPNDATGDARLFAVAAANEAIRLGVDFSYGEHVQHLVTRNGRIEAVQTQQRTIKPDAVVLAAGLGSAKLARSAGYKLPIYPVTGYSVTYDHPHDGTVQPQVGAVSVRHKIAWASFGDRVRFTGYADIGVPTSERHINARFEALENFAKSIYAPAAQVQPQRWSGQRPMTPDGLPIIGTSRHENLYFNCGHGAMGWTMACGSARLLADAVAKNDSLVSTLPYRWDRFR